MKIEVILFHVTSCMRLVTVWFFNIHVHEVTFVTWQKLPCRQPLKVVSELSADGINVDWKFASLLKPDDYLVLYCLASNDWSTAQFNFKCVWTYFPDTIVLSPTVWPQCTEIWQFSVVVDCWPQPWYSKNILSILQDVFWQCMLLHSVCIDVVIHHLLSHLCKTVQKQATFFFLTEVFCYSFLLCFVAGHGISEKG